MAYAVGRVSLVIGYLRCKFFELFNGKLSSRRHKVSERLRQCESSLSY